MKPFYMFKNNSFFKTKSISLIIIQFLNSFNQINASVNNRKKV